MDRHGLVKTFATTECPTENTNDMDPRGEKPVDQCQIDDVYRTIELVRQETRADGSEYPSGVKLALVLSAVCMAVFLMALDHSIVNAAVPRITSEFHSIGDIGWYGSASLLTSASLQLPFGKFYSFFSIKIVFIAAVFIFEIGSLICGAAPNSVALIVGRAIVGFGSAGLFSGGVIVLAHSVPLNKRPLYTGMMGAMYALASIVGPVLGGVFTDKATWRWCFYVNIPVGALAVVLVALFFPEPQRELAQHSWRDRLAQLDPLGTLCLIPAVVCVLLALQWGGTTYPWSSARVIALFALSGALMLGFVGVQLWQGEYATVPPRIFRQRSIWSSALYAFAAGAAFLTVVSFLPIWFQAAKGTSAVESGIDSLPTLIAMVAASLGSGILVSALGYYTPLLIAGSAFMSTGFGLMTTFTPGTPAAAWIAYQVVGGLGIGIGIQTPLIPAQRVLEIADVPVGVALMMFAQTLGGTIFVSVGQNVFINQLVAELAARVRGLDPAFVLDVGAANLQGHIPPDQLPGVALAYNSGVTRAFLVAAVMAVSTILGAAFVEWKSVKVNKMAAAGA